MGEVLGAVRFMHDRNIVHRDLKVRGYNVHTITQWC